MSQVRPSAALRGQAGSATSGRPSAIRRCLAARENSVRLRRIGDAPERHQRHAVQTVAQFLDEMHVGHRRAESVRRVHFQVRACAPPAKQT